MSQFKTTEQAFKTKKPLLYKTYQFNKFQMWNVRDDISQLKA